jgi:alkylhydroperoxidase family enzyme
MTDYRSPLPLQTLDTADGEAAERLAATQQAMGMVPNMYGVMANSSGLLTTYLDGYQRFRSGSGFTPGEQEAVFLTISRFNECDYWMAAHSFIAHERQRPPCSGRGSWSAPM